MYMQLLVKYNTFFFFFSSLCLWIKIIMCIKKKFGFSNTSMFNEHYETAFTGELFLLNTMREGSDIVKQLNF